MKNKYNIKLENQLNFQLKLFIQRWHYTKSYMGLKYKYLFSLRDINNNLMGVIVYSNFLGNNSQKYYKNSIELRRVCCIDDTEKNIESYFISKTIKWLKNNTQYDYIVSYSDPNKGHIGTIYKASNFYYIGKENSINPRAILHNSGKISHIRQYYDKRKGEYSKQAKKLQYKVTIGEAKIINLKKKDIFCYPLTKISRINLDCFYNDYTENKT